MIRTNIYVYIYIYIFMATPNKPTSIIFVAPGSPWSSFPLLTDICTYMYIYIYTHTCVRIVYVCMCMYTCM